MLDFSALSRPRARVRTRTAVLRIALSTLRSFLPYANPPLVPSLQRV